MNKESLNEIAVAVLVIVFLVYIFIIKPLISWFSYHMWVFWLIFGLIIIVAFTFVYFIFFSSKNNFENIFSNDKAIHKKYNSTYKTNNYSASGKVRNILFDDVYDEITKWKPLSSRDEKELEKQLYNFLSGKFKSVKSQYRINKDRIDIVINDKVGIELKIADSKNNLRLLRSQVNDYAEHLQKVIGIIYDVGKLDNVLEEAKKIDSMAGCKSIIVKGNLKRPRNKFRPQTYIKSK